jgi:hypothetical protein
VRIAFILVKALNNGLKMASRRLDLKTWNGIQSEMTMIIIAISKRNVVSTTPESNHIREKSIRINRLIRLHKIKVKSIEYKTEHSWKIIKQSY